MLTLTAQDNHLNLIVGNGFFEGVIEQIGHLAVLSVVVLGPVHRDPRNPLPRLVQDNVLFFCHGFLSHSADSFYSASAGASLTPGGLSLSCFARRFSGSSSAIRDN